MQVDFVGRPKHGEQACAVFFELLRPDRMVFAAVIEVILGVRAEGQSLENVATPLTAIEEATGTSPASSDT